MQLNGISHESQTWIVWHLFMIFHDMVPAMEQTLHPIWKQGITRYIDRIHDLGSLTWNEHSSWYLGSEEVQAYPIDAYDL